MGILNRLFGSSNLSTSTAIYNAAVKEFSTGNYKAAVGSLKKCLRSSEIRDQAAYAICICQSKAGIPISVPNEFMERSEEVASKFMAYNFACHLIREGHLAALTKVGRTSQVEAKIDGAIYVFSITEILNSFNIDVCRRDGSREIRVSDTDANPNPTEADQYVKSILAEIAYLPLAPIPSGGVPSDLSGM